MRRLPVWILCLGLASTLVAPTYRAAAQTGVSFNLRIGDRYRGPAVTFYDEPTVVAVPGRSGVYYVQDSDNDIYRYGNTWYMNYSGDWYRASSYNGPWAFVGYRSVPRYIYEVPGDYRRWSDYRDTHYNWGRTDRYSEVRTDANITLRIGDRYRGPDLGFYDEPELISVRGRSGVYYVRDSDYDVYRVGNRWYLNYNGDWYRASSYRGPWIFVGYRSVPRSVYTVPARFRRWQSYRDRHYTWRDDDSYRYGSTRTGTSFTLRIGDRYRGPNLGFNDMPTMVRVPGTRVYYTQDSDYDVYRYGNYWYMNYNGDWYRASGYSGPWIFVGYRSVPRDVYMVPSDYRHRWSDYRDMHYYWGNEE
jgi:hypothetical protein